MWSTHDAKVVTTPASGGTRSTLALGSMAARTVGRRYHLTKEDLATKGDKVGLSARSTPALERRPVTILQHAGDAIHG